MTRRELVERLKEAVTKECRLRRIAREAGSKAMVFAEKLLATRPVEQPKREPDGWISLRTEPEGSPISRASFDWSMAAQELLPDGRYPVYLGTPPPEAKASFDPVAWLRKDPHKWAYLQAADALEAAMKESRDAE